MKPIFFLLFFCCCSNAWGQIITSIAGSSSTPGYGGDGGPATAARLNQPYDIKFDRAGNMYICEPYNYRIRKINTAGIISTIVGTGVQGFSGDGGPATAAKIGGATGIDIDSSGNILIADLLNSRIRKIDTAGIITTFAGNGTTAISGDGGPATAAAIGRPQLVNIDNLQNVYIAGRIGCRVRKINTAGIITTVAGDGASGFRGDGGPATAAGVDYPYGAFPFGVELYIPCERQNRIRKVNAAGIINTIAGTGTYGVSGDGGPATAAQMYMGFIFVDFAGYLYVPGAGTVRRVDPNGIITTIAGQGYYTSLGDGGPATNASISAFGVCVDAEGSVYIADDYNNRIRKIRNYKPFFVRGAAANFTSCHNVSGPLGIDSLLTATDSNTLQGLKWSIVAGPMHGTVSISDSVAATGSAVTPTTSAYMPDTSYSGLDSFTVRVSDSWVSDTIVIRLNRLPAHIAVSATGPSVLCTGISSAFTATPSGGTWFSSNPAVATVSSSGIARGVATGNTRIFYVSTSVCASDTASVADSVFVPVTPVVAVTKSRDSVCTGVAITFTAAVTHGGFTPAWQWRVSGAAMGTSATTFTYGGLHSTDSVTCTISSSENCAVPAVVTSRALRVRVFPGSYQPSVTFTYSPTVICSGTPVTFTAHPVLGGSAPHYLWRVSGAVSGSGNPFVYPVANANVVSCTLTSNDPTVCTLTDTAESSHTMVVLPTVTPVITIHTTHSDTVSYLGEIITWIAEVSFEGSAPVYQWYHHDGTPITGATNRTYSVTMYGTNDTLYCMMTSNLPCVTSDTVVSNTGITYGAYLFVQQVYQNILVDVNLYPNPANDEVTIDFHYALPESFTIKVTDTWGRTVLTEHVPAGKKQAKLSLHDVAPGVYFVAIASGSSRVVKRLVKE